VFSPFLVLNRLRKRGVRPWLLAAIVSMQLLIGLHHQHAPAAASPDCAACMLAVQLSGGVPPAGPAVLAVAIPDGFAAAPWPPAAAPRTANLQHILPFSQAPPARV
jgi:hypothetical protein